jgi:hypothetical protein
VDTRTSEPAIFYLGFTNTISEHASKVLLKAKLSDKINCRPVNEQQQLVINRMLEDGFKGHMNTSKFAKLALCSTDTLLEDNQELKARATLI